MVANNTNTTPDTPSDEASSEAMVKTPAVSGIDATRLPFTADHQGEATGIDKTMVDDARDHKNVFILGGVKISAPHKGINIVNGKKLIAK